MYSVMRLRVAFMLENENSSSFRFKDSVGTTVGSAVSDVTRLPTPGGPPHTRVASARARALSDVRVLIL